MKPLGIVVFGLALITLPKLAAAQTLPAGIWTGTSVTPAGEEVKLTVEVTRSGDSTRMVINTVEHGSFTLTDVAVAGDTLRFKFQPGPLVDCVLPKQADGSYSGSCTAGETGESTLMVMIPPRKE